MSVVPIVIGAVFAVGGAAAERIASVWPPDEASRRPPGVRMVLLAAASGFAAWGISVRSGLPWWATAVYLVLDPLIVVAAVFVPFNPALAPLDALIGGGAAVAFLGALALLVRGGLAVGDLYLVGPIGLMLGWPIIFSALFGAAFLAAGASLALLVSRRVGMRSYIPFGPFLVAGAVLVLLLDDRALQVVR